MPNARMLCLGIRKGDYVDLFEDVFGQGSLDCVKEVSGTYDRIAGAIAA